MIPTEKSFKGDSPGLERWVGTMEPKAPKRWAALVVGLLLPGLFLFLVLPLRPALFLYVLVAGLAYVLAKIIEARAMVRWVARWL